MEIVNQGFTSCLIEENIESIGRVIFNESNKEQASLVSIQNSIPADSVQLSNILIFILKTQKILELISSQESTNLKEIADLNSIFVNFDVDANEYLSYCELPANDLIRASNVSMTTEYWQNPNERNRFLLGFILWNATNQPMLSVCTETDELEVLAIDEFSQRIKSIEEHYGNVEHFEVIAK